MGVGSWIVVGGTCWFAVSCGLGLVAAKVMAASGSHPPPCPVTGADGRQRSGVTR
jgi:hypothetical protein